METPYFLIHTGLLEENYHAFDRALNACWGRHRIAYSVKTNSLPFVLRFLHERGAMAEVVSDDEYALAGLCGFAPEEIVFNGPIKGKDCFLNAILSGACVHMDSRRELDWLDLLPQDRLFSVGLRVNLDLPSLCSQDVGLEGEGYRFGFSYENGDLAWALSRLAAHKNLRLGGLHLHCNSITRSPRVYGFMARKTADICREFGLLPDYVDMGGGKGYYVRIDAIEKGKDDGSIPGRICTSHGRTFTESTGSEKNGTGHRARLCAYRFGGRFGYHRSGCKGEPLRAHRHHRWRKGESGSAVEKGTVCLRGLRS